jgi:hypothetical protein
LHPAGSQQYAGGLSRRPDDIAELEEDIMISIAPARIAALGSTPVRPLS